MCAVKNVPDERWNRNEPPERRTEPEQRDILKDGIETGKFWDPRPDDVQAPNVQAFVRSWREVIDENRRRLAFFTDAMEGDPSTAESMNFLSEEYASLLPDFDNSSKVGDEAS